MITLRTILGRRSQPLICGEIDRDELQSILSCALTAPDHKRLRPWRYIVVHPEHKDALTRMIVASLPPPSVVMQENQIEQVRSKLGFAPHIVICTLTINRSGSVPELEQVLSAGAAIQNMIIAAESLGYKCCWKTGAWAYNLKLHEKLALDRDTLITAFLGIGQTADAAIAAKPLNRPAYADHFISIEEIAAAVDPADAVEVEMSRI